MTVVDKFRPLAVRLLGKPEFAATLTRSSAQGAPTAAQKVNRAARSAATLTTIPTFAIVGPQTIRNDQGRDITNMVATLLDQPERNDTLTQGTMTYTVGDVIVHAPTGSPIYFEATVTS